jgi:hypothetical protein
LFSGSIGVSDEDWLRERGSDRLMTTTIFFKKKKETSRQCRNQTNCRR